MVISLALANSNIRLGCFGLGLFGSGSGCPNYLITLVLEGSEQINPSSTTRTLHLEMQNLENENPQSRLEARATKGASQTRSSDPQLTWHIGGLGLEVGRDVSGFRFGAWAGSGGWGVSR